jgi:hypothetical protein
LDSEQAGVGGTSTALFNVGSGLRDSDRQLPVSGAVNDATDEGAAS